MHALQRLNSTVPSSSNRSRLLKRCAHDFSGRQCILHLKTALVVGMYIPLGENNAASHALEGLFLLHVGGSIILGDLCMILAGVDMGNGLGGANIMLLRRGTRGMGRWQCMFPGRAMF